MEIKYNDGVAFKITITTDYKLRIKIPKKYAYTDEEYKFVEQCKNILDSLKNEEFPNTLRGKRRDFDSEGIKLEAGSKKKCAHYTYNFQNKFLKKVGNF